MVSRTRSNTERCLQERDGQPDATRRRARQQRVQAIVDGAHVRRALSQGALYEHVDGQHVVTYRGQRFRGPSVDAAIAAAREGTR